MYEEEEEYTFLLSACSIPNTLYMDKKKRKIRKISSLGDILYILYYKNLKNKNQWKYSLSKSVLRFVLNVATFSAFLIYSGIVFHN